MISFYCWITFKGFIRNLKKGSFILKNALFLFTAVFYAFVFALIPQKIQHDEGGEFFHSYFNQTIAILVFFYSFTRIIFPSYKALDEFFPSYLQVPSRKRYLFLVVKDLIQPAYIYLFFFILSLTFFGVTNPVLLVLYGVHALFLGAGLKRSIQFAIDFKRHVFSFLGVLLNLSVVGLCYYLVVYQNIEWTIIVAAWSSYFIGLLTYVRLEINPKKSFSFKSKSLYLKLILNNKRVRKMMLIGYLLKIVFLLVFSIGKESSVQTNSFSFYMFASPLLLFTYVFNNQWGYFKAMWINLEIHTRETKRFFSFILHLLKWFVLIDAIISIYFLVLYSNDISFSILYYGLNLMVFLTMSFVWSIGFPIAISEKTQYKGNASLISVFASFGIVYFISLIQEPFWRPWIIGVCVVISSLAFFFSKYLYEENRYKLFTKLFKS